MSSDAELMRMVRENAGSTYNQFWNPPTSNSNSSSPTSSSPQSKTRSAMASVAAGLAAGAAQGTSSGLFSTINTLLKTKSDNFNQEANRNLQYKMWDRDYQLAKNAGLYHPSQFNSLQGGSIYKLIGNKFVSVPRTSGPSPFST